jgi:hypothetical protein
VGCGSNRIAAERKRKLRGALKDAPRVIPRRNRELNHLVKLHDSIYRRRSG